MLTTRIAGLIGLALTPALVAQVYGMQKQHAAREASVREEAARQVRIASADVAMWGDTLRDTLGILAEEPSIRGLQPEGCTRMVAAALDKVPGSFLLAVTDAEGKVVCNTPDGAQRVTGPGNRPM